MANEPKKICRMLAIALWVSGCATLSPPAPRLAEAGRLSIAGAPAKGDPSAPLVMVEFGDFQCPVSARHMTEIMPELAEAYVQTGDVRYVFYDFPLVQIHSRAVPAAVAARCAGKQGKFWEMHDRLLSQQRSLDAAAFAAHAQALGLDVAAFDECSRAKEPLAAIDEDVAAGMANGVRSTPTFLIGVPVAGEPGTIEIAERIPGVSSYRNVAMLLERALRARGQAAP